MNDRIVAMIANLLPCINPTEFRAWVFAQYWVKDKAKAKGALEGLEELIAEAKREQL